MAAKAKHSEVPKNISEEYYQITEEILSSFSKFRPPVDLFIFREDISQLYPFSYKGNRLSNEQAEEAQALCAAGNLFVSRADHPIYSEHIAKQVGLVLVDANLSSGEAADIIIKAMQLRLSDFFEQPLMPAFELLYRDLMVFTEYIWTDRFRCKLFMRRLATEHNLINHSINCLIVGSWLYINTTSADNLVRRQFDRVSLGLVLHDFGMTKLPAFMLAKAGPLKPEDREKIVLHPNVGIKTMLKLNVGFDELSQTIMEHHERLDGSGYPQHTKDLSKLGRLSAVVDSFCAMIATRPYAQAKQPAEACKELAADRGRYDNAYVTTLLNAYLTNTFASAETVKKADKEDQDDTEES
jgi:hypothetical protein